MSDDLVKLLRQSWDADRSIISQTGQWMTERKEAATRIEELEAENHLLKTSGIIEVAVRNPNVMEYMRHWEGRAEAAEAALEKAMKITEDCGGNEDRNSYRVSRFIHELKGQDDG